MEPTQKTKSHEKTSTTVVRTAVATVEFVFLIPILLRIAVIPANSADKSAIITHIFFRTPFVAGQGVAARPSKS